MTDCRHTVVFDLPDGGTQALVEIWPDGDSPTIAFRDRFGGRNWGPPVEGHETDQPKPLITLDEHVRQIIDDAIEQHPAGKAQARKALHRVIDEEARGR